MSKGRTPHSEQTTISGQLLQIFGLGTLILGDSGIGKSESSLELIARGHRFISDDVVLIKKIPGGRVTGESPLLSQDFMEIRGLGIINIREIFGARSILRRSPIGLIIRLKKWHHRREYDRLGLKFPRDVRVLGARIPQLNIPVAPGRNMATLIEVACKVQLLRRKGYHASRAIIQKLERALS
jgi:HPr kinase/phosphorylase